MISAAASQPTTRFFGDAMAILAGDALFTLAMQTLAIIEGLHPSQVVTLVLGTLVAASGTVDGMIGGQVTDLEGEHQTPTRELLESIHAREDRRDCCAPALPMDGAATCAGATASPDQFDRAYRLT